MKFRNVKMICHVVSMYACTSKLSKNNLSDTDCIMITGKYIKHAQSLIDILLFKGDYDSAEKLKSKVRALSDMRHELLLIGEQ